jgi:hypothetical protein
LHHFNNLTIMNKSHRHSPGRSLPQDLINERRDVFIGQPWVLPSELQQDVRPEVLQHTQTRVSHKRRHCACLWSDVTHSPREHWCTTWKTRWYSNLRPMLIGFNSAAPNHLFYFLSLSKHRGYWGLRMNEKENSDFSRTGNFGLGLVTYSTVLLLMTFNVSEYNSA